MWKSGPMLLQIMRFRSLVEKWADVWVLNEVVDALRGSEVSSRAQTGSRRRVRKKFEKKGRGGNIFYE